MKAFVGNASDADQVKEATRKEKERRKQELTDILHVLSSPEGQRFLWRLMEQCRTFESIWDESERIRYNAGRQDIGHFIMSEIVEAEPEALIGMMRANGKTD